MSTDDRENLPPTEIARRGPGMRDAQRSVESETDRSPFDDLLERVLDVPSQERADFVDSHCDAPEVRRELIELLTKEERLDTFLERPAAVVLSECGGALPGGPALPETIGPYRILERLGEGGMGVVYLAEQDQPVERRLAVKVVRADLSASGARERFVAERRALARLSHPYIAQMYEAGATGEGFPYFAMELVDGEPITTYCDRRQLSIEERLFLFAKVCEGVQHAHQHGIIHRDLKPSNILISEVDGRPVPKLIDFGIAKALDRPLTDVTQLTGFGAVGTPAYMSPESLGLDGHEIDVDTRTDVYALGVVLDELLGGVRPFDLAGATLAKVVQQLQSSEAPRPSARVTALNREDLRPIAEDRGLPVRELSRRLAGDLDWITARAIAKERDERYDSVGDLAADVHRHLTDQPVLASPPSAVYRARKFARRHRAWVVAATLVALALTAGAVGTTIGMVRATREAGRANREAQRASREAEARGAVSEFLKGLFTVSDPDETHGESLTARELLDRGAEKIDRELGEQPEIRAVLMDTIGSIYRELGLYEQAQPLLEGAVAKQARLLGEEHRDTLLSKVHLAMLYRKQGRLDEAAVLFEEVLAVRRRTPDADDEATLRSMIGLGTVMLLKTRYGDAETVLLEALEGCRRVLGNDHPDTAEAMLVLTSPASSSRSWKVNHEYPESQASEVASRQGPRARQARGRLDQPVDRDGGCGEDLRY